MGSDHPTDANASIGAAVYAARTAAARAAVADARKQAQLLADAAGLKLGAIVALEEVPPGVYGGLAVPLPAPFPTSARGRAVPVLPAQPFAPLLSPFGKDRYCATLRRAVLRRGKDGRRRRVGSRRVRRCIVPPRVTTQVEVTFAIG